MNINQLMNLCSSLPHEIEPLPEPLRTIFFVLVILCALVLPIITCIYSSIRRSFTKRRVEEIGSSWEDVDSRVPKQEDSMIDNFECITVLILIIFVGIVVVLILIIGPVVRDIAVIMLIGFTIWLIIVICPILMIWSIRVDDRRNVERIRLAEEDRRLRETGQDI